MEENDGSSTPMTLRRLFYPQDQLLPLWPKTVGLESTHLGTSNDGIFGSMSGMLNDPGVMIKSIAIINAIASTTI